MSDVNSEPRKGAKLAFEIDVPKNFRKIRSCHWSGVVSFFLSSSLSVGQ